jgi:hypothetical protein
MLKAPKGRLASLTDVLGRELRNLPVEAPSAHMADALVKKLEALGRIMRTKTVPSTQRRKG